MKTYKTELILPGTFKPVTLEVVPVGDVAELQEQLASALADKHAYAQNAIDLRTSLDAVTLNLTRCDATLRKAGSADSGLREAAADLVLALDEQEALRDEIRSSRRPPHTDFWHQSIAAKEAAVKSARERVRRLSQ